MIFRLTQKLAKKIGVTPLPASPLDQNPYMDWCAHLFTVKRIQYVILTNTASLYSVIMHGRGVSSDKKFIQESLTCMKEVMTIDGNTSIFEHFIEPFAGEVSFCKMTDRRVMGSMNDFVFQSKFYLTYRENSLAEVSRLVNHTPMTYFPGGHPKSPTCGHLKIPHPAAAFKT